MIFMIFCFEQAAQLYKAALVSNFSWDFENWYFAWSDETIFMRPDQVHVPIGGFLGLNKID